MRGDDFQQAEMYSYLSPEQRVPAHHPVAPHSGDDRCGVKGDVAVVRQAVCPDGTAVDCARKVVAGLAAAGVLHGAERAVVDGRIELQPVFPLVVGLSMDDPVWDASTFSKNRDRLLKKEG